MVASQVGSILQLFFSDGETVEIDCSTEQLAEHLCEKMNSVATEVAIGISEELDGGYVCVH